MNILKKSSMKMSVQAVIESGFNLRGWDCPYIDIVNLTSKVNNYIKKPTKNEKRKRTKMCETNY